MYELTEMIMDLLELCIELEEHSLPCSNCPLMQSGCVDEALDLPISMEELIQNVLEGGSAWN